MKNLENCLHEAKTFVRFMFFRLIQLTIEIIKNIFSQFSCEMSHIVICCYSIINSLKIFDDCFRHVRDRIFFSLYSWIYINVFANSRRQCNKTNHLLKQNWFFSRWWRFLARRSTTFFFRCWFFFRNYYCKFFINRNFLRRRRDFCCKEIFDKNFFDFFFLVSYFFFIFSNVNIFDHFLFFR